MPRAAIFVCSLQEDKVIHQELQQVLADKAALEEEKRRAQVSQNPTCALCNNDLHEQPNYAELATVQHARQTLFVKPTCSTLQEEADGKQREFERARALLDAQLRQLSGHISSKEALIVTLQHNEQEARLLSQCYLVSKVIWL